MWPSMMPAEWAPHAATWLAWPHNTRDWPSRFGPIPWVYASIIGTLTRHERVRLLVQDAAEKAKAKALLARADVDLKMVDLIVQPTDRVWMRDSGAIFVKRGAERVAVGWKFNAWAKYPDWKKDVKVPTKMAKIAGVALDMPVVGKERVVLEGGAIDVDGEGTLLATEECLLQQETQVRNPGMSRATLERVLDEHLGARTVIWLGKGIVGDDTHGHIDDLARFVGPGRVVLCVEPDARDPNHAILAENHERLAGARDAAGRSIEVIPLPMPRAVVCDGQRLPASYANFYVANGVVIVPTFDDPADRVALGTLAECFPDRTVVGIHARDLVWGLGTLHCMSQQEPA